MRQRNVDDGCVQHLHEGAEGDDDRYQPGIGVGFPAGVGITHRTVTVGVDGDTERQGPDVVEAAVDDDLDRHAADDLHEVAGGIFGGEGGEAGAATILDAVHVAAQFQVRIGIDIHRHLLAGAHVSELSFLEVRGDPDLRRDDVEHLLSGLHEGAEIDVPARDLAVLRRPEIGVGQVDFGGARFALACST